MDVEKQKFPPALEKQAHELAEDIQKNVGTALFTAAYGEREQAFECLKKDAQKLEDNPGLKPLVQNDLEKMARQNNALPEVYIDNFSNPNSSETIKVNRTKFLDGHPSTDHNGGVTHSKIGHKEFSLEVGPHRVHMTQADIKTYQNSDD